MEKVTCTWQTYPGRKREVGPQESMAGHASTLSLPASLCSAVVQCWLLMAAGRAAGGDGAVRKPCAQATLLSRIGTCRLC